MHLIPDSEFSLIVDATSDHFNYFILFQLNYAGVLKAFANGKTLQEIILQMISSCREAPIEEEHKHFRLRMVFKNEEVYLFGNCPVKSYQKSKVLAIQSDLTVAQNRFSALTPREVEILLFIYKGYDLGRVEQELHITLDTYRNHKKHVFEKMNFHSTRELAIWCEKYLNLLFQSHMNFRNN